MFIHQLYHPQERHQLSPSHVINDENRAPPSATPLRAKLPQQHSKLQLQQQQQPKLSLRYPPPQPQPQLTQLQPKFKLIANTNHTSMSHNNTNIKHSHSNHMIQSESHLIKNITVICCMIHQVKNELDRLVQKSETNWENHIGSSIASWESESVMVEFCTELNPNLLKWRQVSHHMDQLVHLENEVLNVLDEFVELVCSSVRKYCMFMAQKQPKSNLNRHQTAIDFMSVYQQFCNKRFFREIVVSNEFKNALQQRIQKSEKESKLTSMTTHIPSVPPLNYGNQVIRACQDRMMMEDEEGDSEDGDEECSQFDMKEPRCRRKLFDEELVVASSYSPNHLIHSYCKPIASRKMNLSTVACEDVDVDDCDDMEQTNGKENADEICDGLELQRRSTTMHAAVSIAADIEKYLDCPCLERKRDALTSQIQELRTRYAAHKSVCQAVLSSNNKTEPGQ